MKNYSLLTLCSFIFFIKESGAQTTFQKTLSTISSANCVKKTFDGNYIVAGVIYIDGAYLDNALLMKLDSTGAVIWMKNYGGIADEGFDYVEQTKDGGYIATGSRSDFNEMSDVYLVKTRANGDTAWTKTYGGSDYDYATTVHQTNDGGFILAGDSRSFSGGQDFDYIIKTDSLGNVIWSKTLGNSNQGAYSQVAIETMDGEYITAMGFANGGEGIVKMDAAGNPVWSKLYYAVNTAGYALQQTKDSGFIILLNPAVGSSGYYLIKTNSQGDFVWAKSYLGNSISIPYDLKQTNDGGYIIAGQSGDFTGNYIQLIKTNALGDTLWTRVLGAVDLNIKPYSVLQTPDKGFIVTGATSQYLSNNNYAYVLKTDSIGVTECNNGKNLFSVKSEQPSNQDPYVDKINDIFVNSSATNVSGNVNNMNVNLDDVCQNAGIAPVETGKDLIIFPNPSSDAITITNLPSSSTISISNLLGQTIFFTDKTTSINVSDFPSGFYLVQVKTKDKIFEGKFEKN